MPDGTSRRARRQVVKLDSRLAHRRPPSPKPVRHLALGATIRTEFGWGSRVDPSAQPPGGAVDDDAGSALGGRPYDRLDVEDRRAVHGFQAADAERIPTPVEQGDPVQTDGVRAMG